MLLNLHRRLKIAVNFAKSRAPQECGMLRECPGPPFGMGARLQQLPGQKVELDGWIKGHQLGLCFKIFKICLNLPLSTKNSSFQRREVFHFHVFLQFCLVLLYVCDFRKVSPFTFWKPSTKGSAWLCSILLKGKEQFTSVRNIVFRKIIFSGLS